MKFCLCNRRICEQIFLVVRNIFVVFYIGNPIIAVFNCKSVSFQFFYNCSFLAVNSNTDDKELSDKILYQSVVNQEQREKLEKDRDAFYKNGGIVVEETTTKISNTKKAEYQKKEVGVVDCETTVKGTANGEAFEKKYTMQMVVKRDENDVVTVYEINSITWE